MERSWLELQVRQCLQTAGGGRWPAEQVKGRANRSVTRERLYIDTMQQVYTSTSKVMLDARGSGNLLYLPLDKLMQQVAAPLIDQSGVARQPSPEQPPASVPETAPRSREALRERGRGER